MDIFWVLDPDPHNNRCGSATLVSGTGIHLGLILFRRISLSKSTFFRVVKRHFIEVLFLLGFFIAQPFRLFSLFVSAKGL